MVQVVAPEGWSLEDTATQLSTPPATSSQSVTSANATTKSPSVGSAKNNQTSSSDKNNNPAKPTSKKKSVETAVAAMIPIGALSAIPSSGLTTTSPALKIPSSQPATAANVAPPPIVVQPVKIPPSGIAPPFAPIDPTAAQGISWIVPAIGAAALLVTVGISWWLLSQLQEEPKHVPVITAQSETKPSVQSTIEPNKNQIENAGNVKTVSENKKAVTEKESAVSNPVTPYNIANQTASANTTDPSHVSNPNPTQTDPLANPDPKKQNPVAENQPLARPNSIDSQPKSFTQNGSPDLKNPAGKLLLEPVAERSKGSDLLLIPREKDSVAASSPNKKEPDTIASIDQNLVAGTVDNKKIAQTNKPDMPQLERVPYTGVDTTILEMALAGVSYENVPLYRVLDDISDLTHTPMQVDTKALEQNGAAMMMPVRFKSANITVGNALDKILEPFGLVLIEQPHFLVIGQVDRRTEATRSRYAVEDLCHDKMQPVAELLTPIQRLIAPESWAIAKVETQDSTLIVEQTYDIHDQIVTWLEKLRVARGLPLQTKYDANESALRRFNPARYQIEANWARAKQSLNKKITAGFPRPETLSEILRHLQQQSGVALVIDHAALDQAETSPASTATLTVREVSLQEALAKLLSPLGLGFVPIDSQSILISSTKELTIRKSIEWYSLQGLMAKNQMPTESEKVIPWLNEQLKKTASQFEIIPTASYWDQASHTLVVKGSPLLHRDLSKIVE